MSTFKNKLEELVTYLGITKADLAKEIGISNCYFYAIFKGNIPSEKAVARISKKYGIPVEYFSNETPISFYISKPKTIKEKKIETGLRLKETRNKKGISQTKLAEIIGVTEQLISAIEVGRVTLIDEKAEAIANALDVEKNWLLFGKEFNVSYPINDKMLKWLNEHEEIRKDLWEKYNKSLAENSGI